MTINIKYFSKTKLQPIKSLGLGVFDGVHLGHQQIISQVDTVLTFNPHPTTIINPKTELLRLSTPEEMATYVNQVACLNFDNTIAAMSADEFLNDIILTQLSPKKIVVGYDYFFGSKRKGTPEYLKAWGKTHNIDVTIVKAFSKDDTIVKSKLIRQLFLDNHCNKAIELLGHPYLIYGQVVKGDQRGTSLGFPTANLEVAKNKLIPPTGVYKGHVKIQNTTFKTFIYIGSKPTFNGNKRTIEAYIHGFSGNLYDQKLGLHIEQFIRNEIKFKSSQDLISQIKKDLGV